MGRNSLPDWAKKKRLTISLSPPTFHKVGDESKQCGKPMSDIVENVLERVLLSSTGYAKYMIRQKELELSFWKHEFEKHKVRDQMIKDKLLNPRG